MELTKFQSEMPLRQKALVFILTSLGYFFLGVLSLKLATINEFASPIWSPSGFAMGMLLLFGLWLTPAIFVGAFLTNATLKAGLLSLTPIAMGNMLEALVGVILIKWILQQNRFKNFTELFAIVVTAALACTVSASIGVSTLFSSDVVTQDGFFYAWYTWWSGDAVGVMIVLPLFLEFLMGSREKSFNWKNSLGFFVLALFFNYVSYSVFVKENNQAFSWILCPFFILAGNYFGKVVSRSLLILSSIVIVIFTAFGHGPFEFGSLNLNLIYVQCLLISYSFSVLFVRTLDTDFKVGTVYKFSTLFGWLCIFAVIYTTSRVERKYLEEDLQSVAKNTVSSLKKSVLQYELLLESASAYASTKKILETKDWKNFVDSMNLEKNFDAIHGLGFISYVKTNQIQNFLKVMKDRGNHNFEIKEIDKEYEKKFEDKFIISYIEPREKNTPALGLNIGSEILRRQTAERSKELKKTMGSREIRLVQDNQKRSAFLVLTPTWNEDKFLGWAYAPVITKTFFSKTFINDTKDLEMEVFQNGESIYQSFDPRFNISINQKFIINKSLTIFGLENHFHFYPTTYFFTRHNFLSAPLALLLSLFMLFISGYLLEQLTFGQKAEKLVKKRTQELEENRIKLINSSKMATLGEMASGMAHEINNPITIILGKLKIIKIMLEELNINNLPLNTEISRIEINTERIGKIIRGLKSFSRAAHDDPFELVPLENIINETLDLCSERFKVNGITINIQDIPQVCLVCRASQISQVFLNLLNNSSDALVDQEMKLISMDFEIQEPDKIFIFVSDSGPGIPEDISDKIMEPFFTTKSVGKGTGLGLSIAKSILESHGATIVLDKNTKHTRFIIEFPLKYS